jgi:hypothetical protein
MPQANDIKECAPLLDGTRVRKMIFGMVSFNRIFLICVRKVVDYDYFAKKIIITGANA